MVCEPNAKSWFFRNIANIVTLLGLKLCFWLLWLVIFHRDWILSIFFLVGGILLTDLLDGSLARGLKIVSAFGGAMDRLRDKLLLGIVFFFLLSDQGVDLGVKIIIIVLLVLETTEFQGGVYVEGIFGFPVVFEPQ